MNLAVGVDGSPESWRALQMTARLAEAFGGHIDVLHARALEGFGGTADGGAPPPLSETFAALEDQAHDEARDFRDHRPAEVLLNFQRESAVELIVVDSRGQGLAARSVLGSTANELVNLSPVPVLVVP